MRARPRTSARAPKRGSPSPASPASSGTRAHFSASVGSRAHRALVQAEQIGAEREREAIILLVQGWQLAGPIRSDIIGAIRARGQALALVLLVGGLLAGCGWSDAKSSTPGSTAEAAPAMPMCSWRELGDSIRMAVCVGPESDVRAEVWHRGGHYGIGTWVAQCGSQHKEFLDRDAAIRQAEKWAASR